MSAPAPIQAADERVYKEGFHDDIKTLHSAPKGLSTTWWITCAR